MSVTEVSREKYTSSQHNPMFPSDEGAEKNRDEEIEEEKIKLSEVYPKKYTYAMVGGIVLNIIMLLYSHLAVRIVMKSSTCPEGFDGCPEPIDTTNLIDACLNPNDEAILVPGNTAFDEVPLYMAIIGLDCLGADQCIVDSIVALHGLTPTCASCYSLSADCAVEFCFGQCLANALSSQCLRCNSELCDPAFEVCTGIDFPSTLNFTSDEPPGGGDEDDDVILVPGEECFDRSQFDLFKVYNLTFINTLEETINGGSLPLALLILLSSGIWPYMKNFIMLYVWLYPLDKAKRERYLRILTILGKWSLVDVFAFVIIINAVIIQKILSGNSPLIVFAEPRPGLYLFGIAALWALAQTELIKYFDKQRVKEEENKLVQFKIMTDKQHMKMKILKLLTAIASVVSFWFSFMGLVSLNLSFVLEGRITEFIGINSFGYSTGEMASGLVDACSIYDGHESIAGAYFLSFLFIILVAVIPLTTCLLLFATSITFTPALLESKLMQITYSLSNFAALDVFFLSVITLASQFEGLIDSAVGEGVDEQCGVTESAKERGEFCITFLGTIEGGTWFILFATLMFWFALFTGTKLINLTKSLRC